MPWERHNYIRVNRFLRMNAVTGKMMREVLSLLEAAGYKREAVRVYHSVKELTTQSVRTESIDNAETVFIDDDDVLTYIRGILDMEQALIEDLIDRLRPDDVFYDIGAGFGTWCCFAADALDFGSVVAFEPHTARLPYLRRHTTYNNIDTEVRVEPLGDSTQRLEVQGTELTMRPGDSVVEEEQLPRPTVVKMDIEGAELAALRGLKTTLGRDDCRLVYCELHPDDLSGERQNGRISGEDVRRVHSLLSTTDDSPPYIRAVRETSSHEPVSE
jgi:precorrin-6B methylase 2